MIDTSAFHLPDREATLVNMAADGLTDQEIAHQLGISVHTVNTYWNRLRKRLNAPSRTAVLARLLVEQAKLSEKALREELNRRLEAEARLRETLGLVEEELTETKDAFGARIIQRLQIMQVANEKAKALARHEEALSALHGIIYQSSSVEPFQCIFMSDTGILESSERVRVLSGESSVYSYVEPTDMMRILSKIAPEDNFDKKRFAFLYRIQTLHGLRYFLSITRNHGQEGEDPTYFSGLAIDVQDLVDQGVIDPSAECVWRLAS